MILGDVISINTENLNKNYPFEIIKYIDIGSVGEGVISDLDEISVENAPSRAKRIVKNNDTILSTVRPQNRSFYFFKEVSENTVASTGFAVLSPKNEKIDGRFLYYYISDKSFTTYLANHEKGAAYPAITTDVIFKKEINLPPISTQKRIASILSSYDDLIENNLKRIKLLEETAQNIYKEWFVNFRFPNYENTPFNEETGMPEGWEMKKISETDLEIGDGNYSSKYPKSSDFIDSGIPFFSTREMSNGRLTIIGVKRISEEQHLTLKKGHLMSGDVLLSTRGSIGKVVYVDDEFEGCNINAQLVYFRCNNTSFYNSFLFYQLSLPANYSRLLNVGTGTAQPQLPIKTLNQFEILYPNSDIQKLFYNKTSLFIKQISALYKQNQKLKEARDILLPRLMNRTIEV